MRYALEISYNGTKFHGWQSQKNHISVQEVIEKKLSQILSQNTRVSGCGRTDAGVHATHFVLHFDFESELPKRFAFKMNQMLPRSIAIFSVCEVTDKFHSRFSALHRKYIYKTTCVKDPFQEYLSLFLFKKPDISRMNDACSILLRHTDFASFCKSGGDNKTTLCDLMEAQCVETEVGMEFHVKANRFLRNMVRALMGTLLQVGYGDVSLEDFEQIILSGNRSSAGKSVAAQGLYLVEVGYNWDEYRK